MSSHGHVPSSYTLYRSRWLMLSLFCFTCASNASLWTTFAPISTDSAEFFFPKTRTTTGNGTETNGGGDDDNGGGGISNNESTAINMLALLYQIFYLPGSLLASVLVQKGGLRPPLLIGSLLTFVGAALRYIAVLTMSPSTTSPPPSSKSPLLYIVVFVGQSLSAVAQPCFVNAPGLLAANWFGQSERDVAVTIASLFAVVGNAVGQVLPPMMVYSDDTAAKSTNTAAAAAEGVDPDIVSGMKNLLLCQAVIAFVAYLLVLFFFKSHPQTPPSSSTAARDAKKHSDRALRKSIGGGGGGGSRSSSSSSNNNNILRGSASEVFEDARSSAVLDDDSNESKTTPLLVPPSSSKGHQSNLTLFSRVGASSNTPPPFGEGGGGGGSGGGNSNRVSFADAVGNLSTTHEVDDDDDEEQSTTASWTNVKAEIAILFSDKAYMHLFVSFGLGLSLFNALLTVLNNLLSPCSYSEDDAGNFAGVLIGAGLVGAGIAGAIMDVTHAYRPLLKAGFCAAAGCCVFLVFNIRSDNSTMLGVAFGLLGFAMIPMLPVMIENAIECTYPISEELSSGILFTAGNVFGIPIVFIMQGLINSADGKCGEWDLPVNIMIVVCAAICAFVACRYNGEYKRMRVEREAKEEEEGGGGGGGGGEGVGGGGMVAIGSAAGKTLTI